MNQNSSQNYRNRTAFNGQAWNKPLSRRDVLKLGLYGGLALGVSGSPLLKGCAQKRPGKLPNIIVLTVDTLRADHMALYGYHRNTMPVIESFAKTAVVFDNAIVSRGSTCPSYASMLTGLYPYHHGLYYEGHLLHEDLPTLPEVLKSAGYHTAAFVSNFVLLGRIFGGDKGFDIYDDYLGERELNRPNYERTATNTTKAILQWLQSEPPQPFLLFTNYIDPHGPYHPPPRLRDLYRSNQQRILKEEQIPPYQRLEGSLNYFDYIDWYDEEIRFVDECMDVLIDQFKRMGLWDDALVIFTADHGEYFGEHGMFFEHQMHLWEETTRVPLIMRLPSQAENPKLSQSRRVGGSCSPMDIMPTILDYLDIKSPRTDGQSLLPGLMGRPDDDRTIFLEFPSSRLPWNWPDIYAIRSTTHKLIRIYDKDSDRRFEQAVFDITADPLEQHPLQYDHQLKLHRKLAKQLNSKIDESREYELPFSLVTFQVPLSQREAYVEKHNKQPRKIYKTLSEEDVKKLRSLGYVD